MIRVLHIIDNLRAGGAQSLVLDLASHDPELDVHCEVAALHGTSSDMERFERRGIKVWRLSPKKWSPRLLTRLLGLIRRNNYDILHFHLRGANWIIKPLCALFSKSRRVEHDHYAPDLAFRKVWSILPSAITHLCSNHIVAVSQAVADALNKWEFVAADKITVIPNGVDTGRFSPIRAEHRKLARSALGIDQKSFVVGSLGRLEREKNFRVLIHIADLMPDIKFVVAGEGSERDALSFEAEGKSNFQLLGEISDRENFLAALDVFVLPSIFESFGIVIVEAMACGLPIIASRISAVSTILGDTNVLVDVGDEMAIRDAIQIFRSDLETAVTNGKLGRERVCEYFDIAKVRAEVAALYKTIREKYGPESA